MLVNSCEGTTTCYSLKVRPVIPLSHSVHSHCAIVC